MKSCSHTSRQESAYTVIGVTSKSFTVLQALVKSERCCKIFAFIHQYDGFKHMPEIDNKIWVHLDVDIRENGQHFGVKLCRQMASCGLNLQSDCKLSMMHI